MVYSIMFTTTSGSTGGTAVTAVQAGASCKTAALTDDVDLIPYGWN